MSRWAGESEPISRLPLALYVFPGWPASRLAFLWVQVGNQREVERWIDVMVFHAGQVPLGAGGKAFGREP